MATFAEELESYIKQAQETGRYNYFDPNGGGNTWSLGNFGNSGGVYGDGLKIYNWSGGALPAELTSRFALATPEAIQNASDPINGAGNNEGGSDLSNLATLAAFVSAGHGLTNMLGAGAGTGTAADWWSGMPSGTTEASFGGLGGEVAGADSLVNLASDVGGLDDAINVDYSGMSNVDNFGGGNYAPTGNEADWWTTVPQGTAEAAAGGVGSAASPSLWSQVSGFMKENPWVAPLAGTVLGSGINYLGATKAAKAQQQGAQGQQDLLRYMYDQNRADLEPWRKAGVGALGNLVNLTTPGKQLDTAMLDPGYAFRQSEGEKRINRAAAARGLWDSGRTYKALDRFNQDYATGEFGNVYNRNANLAGLGQVAVGQGVQAAQNYGQQAGNSMLDAANARASGYVGGANALSGGLSSLINQYTQQAMLDKILGRG